MPNNVSVCGTVGAGGGPAAVASRMTRAAAKVRVIIGACLPTAKLASPGGGGNTRRDVHATVSTVAGIRTTA